MQNYYEKGMACKKICDTYGIYQNGSITFVILISHALVPEKAD